MRKTLNYAAINELKNLQQVLRGADFAIENALMVGEFSPQEREFLISILGGAAASLQNNPDIEVVVVTKKSSLKAFRKEVASLKGWLNANLENFDRPRWAGTIALFLIQFLDAYQNLHKDSATVTLTAALKERLETKIGTSGMLDEIRRTLEALE